jgi:hypothetical protein
MSPLILRKVTLFLNMAILWGAGATTLMPMNVQKLSESSQLVVHGRVVKVEEQGGRRSAVVQVLEQVRGREVSSPLRVELLQRGSREMGWVERVADAVEFKVNEEVLVFLSQSKKSGNWVPVGLKQGKYRVVSDKRGVRRALSWRDASTNQVSDAELLDVSKTEVIHKSKVMGASNNAISGFANEELEKAETLSNLINQVRGFAQ